MNETEEQIRQTLDRLIARQSELAAEYGMVEEAIKSLERLLGGGVSTAPDSLEPRGEPVIAPPKILEERLPKFDTATFFGLNQRDAVIKILRVSGKPLSMLQILEILQEAKYPFKTKAPRATISQ